MDLEEDAIDELLARAQDAWEQVKSELVELST